MKNINKNLNCTIAFIRQEVKARDAWKLAVDEWQKIFTTDESAREAAESYSLGFIKPLRAEIYKNAGLEKSQRKAGATALDRIFLASAVVYNKAGSVEDGFFALHSKGTQARVGLYGKKSSTDENSQQPTANSQQPTADSQQPTADSQQPTADSQQPTADSQQPTADSQQPTADSQQPTATPVIDTTAFDKDYTYFVNAVTELTKSIQKQGLPKKQLQALCKLFISGVGCGY